MSRVFACDSGFSAELFRTTPTTSGGLVSVVSSPLLHVVCRGFGMGAVLGAGLGCSAIKALVSKATKHAKDFGLVSTT